jgi:hypothetical protein
LAHTIGRRRLPVAGALRVWSARARLAGVRVEREDGPMLGRTTAGFGFGVIAVAASMVGAGCAVGNMAHRGETGSDIDAASSAIDSGASPDARPDAGALDSGEDAPSTLDAGLDDDAAASVTDAGEDAFVPGVDAFVVPIDAFVPPVDAYAPPADAWVAPLCMGVNCSAMTSACAVGTCNPATGACYAMPRADGTSCSDSNACTGPDVCMAGSCTSGALIDCSSMATACATASCNPASGCVLSPVAAGTPCTDSNACTTGDACMAGTCRSGTATDCSAMSGACVIGTCDTSTGACGTMPRPNGTACTDGDPCTTPDACMAGTCRAGAPVSCASMTSACATGTCNPGTGACYAAPLPNGTTCSDGNACTTGETCSSGTCASGTPTSCTGLDGPCTVGMCSASTGGCVAMPRPNGTVCGGSGCGASTCTAGTCTASAAIDCGACGGGLYCTSGTCGANPTMLSYGFESGALPAGWTAGLGGTAAWSVISGGAHGGTYRVRSGAIGDSAQSRMGFTITLATTTMVSFWLQTSTETDYDELQVLVDGVLQGAWSGTHAWTQGAALVPAGTHAIEWRYVKDVATMGGSDTVWIDDVTLAPATETALTGFESASLPAGFTSMCWMHTGGTGSCAGLWTSRTDSVHAGSRAAGSGTIAGWQATALYYTITAATPSVIEFWYRVSSETPDRLRFYVDGVEQTSWGGDIPWAHAGFSIGAGTHMLEWRYMKDGSASALSDRAWVDDIAVATVATGPALCGP